MSAVYSIFTSPNHPPVPDHLPTLIVTPHGRPAHILYTYLHTNVNRENYLLTPSEAGDLCVAKLFPPTSRGGAGGSSAHSHGGNGGGPTGVKCEASRNLRWTISNTGIQNPVYKLTLPNPEQPQQDQPLFQVSKPNPHAGWWTLFYFTYAGHLIPPKRVEFGRIQKNSPESGGGTRVAITGKTDEEKAVWKTLGESNEDMVEWIVICAALVVLDDEIISAAEKAGVGLSSGQGTRMPPGATSTGGKMRAPGPPPALHATGTAQGMLPNNRPPPSPRGYGAPPPNGPPPPRGPPPQQQQQQQQQQRGPSPVPPVNGYPLPPPMSNGQGPPPPRPPQPPQQQQPPPRSASHMQQPQQQQPPYHPQQPQQQYQQPPQQDPRRGPPPPINVQHSQSYGQPGPSSVPYGQQPPPPRGASSLQALGQRMPMPPQQNGDPRYQPQQPQQLPSSLQPGSQPQQGRAPSSYRPGPPSQLQQPMPPLSPGYGQPQPPNSGGSLGGASRMLQAQVQAKKLTKAQW